MTWAVVGAALTSVVGTTGTAAVGTAGAGALGTAGAGALGSGALAGTAAGTIGAGGTAGAVGSLGAGGALSAGSVLGPGSALAGGSTAAGAGVSGGLLSGTGTKLLSGAPSGTSGLLKAEGMMMPESLSGAQSLEGLSGYNPGGASLDSMLNTTPTQDVMGMQRTLPNNPTGWRQHLSNRTPQGDFPGVGASNSSPLQMSHNDAMNPSLFSERGLNYYSPSTKTMTNAWLASQLLGGDKKQQRSAPAISAPGRAGNPSAMMMRQPVGLLGGGRPQRRSFRR
jgi:hypothetical protein